MHRHTTFGIKESRLFCFGCGMVAQEVIDYYPDLAARITCFVDNDSGKWGGSVAINGVAVPVHSPEYLTTHLDSGSAVMITSMYHDDIARQLERMQLPPGIPVYNYEVLFAQNAAQDIPEWQEGRRVFYMHTPSHTNMGDHAIVQGGIDFIRNLLGVNPIEVPDRLCSAQVFPDVAAKIAADDIVVVSGGFFLGSVWVDGGAAVRRIVAALPQNPIVVLPQTIHYHDDPAGLALLAEDRRVFCSHPRLMICARDAQSSANIKAFYPGVSTRLCPDMALFPQRKAYNNARSGVLLCLRSDIEAALDAREHDDIARIAEGLGPVRLTSMMNSRRFYPHQRDEKLEERYAEFSQAQLVITDRLHGVIFAAITGTPCLALGNNNHKIAQTCRWLEQLSYIRYVPPGQLTPALMGEYFGRTGQYDPSYYAGNFSALAQAISAL